MGVILPLRIALPAVATALLALTLVFAAPAPSANAAAKHAGIPDITPYGAYLGNYLAPDGSRVYCIDSSLEWPSGPTSGPAIVDGIVTTWGAPLPADSAQKLNFVLLKYGQTDDPVQAAVVAAFVNAYTSGWARDLGAGHAAGAWYMNGNAAVMAVYDAIWADAQANAVPVATATATITMTDTRSGTLAVDATLPGATGSVVLHGGVRASDGASEFAVGASERIAVRGVPLDTDSQYSITATISYTSATPAGTGLAVYSTEGQQRTIRGTTTGSVAFGTSASTEPIPLQFTPALTTVVESAEVAVGTAFVDTLAVTAEGSWRLLSDGGPVRVVAEGVLYGPFGERPVTSAAVPARAPVAGRVSLTFSGPGDYASPGSLVAERPGYYTWVWTIQSASQDPVTRAALPAGFSFVSPFGLAEETHRVPVPPAKLAATGSQPQVAGVVGLGLIAVGAIAGISARGRRWH